MLIGVEYFNSSSTFSISSIFLVGLPSFFYVADFVADEDFRLFFCEKCL